MSRARPFHWGGEKHWFDRHKDNHKATSAQLELLADVLGIDIDDLLDEPLTQREVRDRLNETTGKVVPQKVINARRARKIAKQEGPSCRICAAHGWRCDGSMTRHHFVPRWLMRELDNYVGYAARSVCTIPVCVGRHRDLHYRGADQTDDKSIVEYLNEQERKIAQKMLDELFEQRPVVFKLLAGGNEHSYEWQLVRDYQLGRFCEALTGAAEHALDAAAL